MFFFTSHSDQHRQINCSKVFKILCPHGEKIALLIASIAVKGNGPEVG